MHEQKELYANKIFFNAALPLVKVIANDVPSLKKQFEKVHAVIQVSALDPDVEGGKTAMHFVVNGSDDWQVHLNAVEPNPHVELEFRTTVHNKTACFCCFKHIVDTQENTECRIKVVETKCEERHCSLVFATTCS